jgi:hypothetical protein
MIDKKVPDHPVIKAILEDEPVKTEELTKEDWEVVERWWTWSRSWSGTGSIMFQKLDGFKRINSILKQ